MSIKSIATIIGLLIALNAQTQDLINYVNPFIGTSNGGNTNPGAVRPWGMVSISPFNSYDPVTKSRGPSPYYFGNKYICGFTHLNMSGVGCSDLGIFCLMPTTGKLDFDPTKNRSEYSNEFASPGYYSVQLDQFNTKVEVTTTLRSSISCYTFPKGKSNILLNLGLGLTTQEGGALQRISDTEVEGYKNIGNICGLKSIQTVYFVAQVSKKPSNAGVWSDGREYSMFKRDIAGNNIGAFFSFYTQENEEIFVKVGISYVSIENARKNLEQEQPGFDFENIRTAAEQSWNAELSKIQVEGGTEVDKVKFYTAIYHTLIHPSVFNDVNGEYVQMESEKIGKVKDYTRYSIFSLWDTYRNLHPFLSLVYPKQQSDMVKSLLGMAQESGWLPRWEYAGIESNAMVGDPALSVIADTWLRGIQDFDIQAAYKAMKHNALTPEKENYMRPGMDDWLKYGYIPENAKNILHPFTSSNAQYFYENMRNLRIVWGSVSTSLEYCIADWNLAQLAKALGKTDDYNQFYHRSMFYKNNFDTATGFMRAKLYNGNWVEPFNPANNRSDCYVEGSSWNYTFMVPHDIPGLIKLMGGSKNFIQKLDTCFAKRYFDITNEPDLAYPYLYNNIKGEEWKTQSQVHKLINEYFNNTPGGLPGNDDCGTLSAWLIFSMMGLYPDCPGNTEFQISSPVFNKVTISLDSAYYPGKTFIISIDKIMENKYLIKSVQLNEKTYEKFTINNKDIIRGGSMTIKLKP
jgi:predicted alpha-1,2-mannosidase